MDKNIKVGAVIIFNDRVSREETQAFLDKLKREAVIQNPAKANEFDSSFGGPVWYIP